MKTVKKMKKWPNEVTIWKLLSLLSIETHEKEMVRFMICHVSVIADQY